MNPSLRENDHLRRLMDACRGDSEDLSLPEMQALATALRQDGALRSQWESRQRSDRRLAGAMHDVSVPSGLAERILAAAEQARAPQGSVATAVSLEGEPDAEVRPADARPAPRIGRRRAWQGAALVAALLLGMVAAWQLWLRPPETVSKGRLEASAQDWFRQALRPGKRMAANVKPPVPFPRGSVALPLQSWQRMAVDEEPSLVAFDLTQRRFHGAVYLFVARTGKQYQVRSVPYTPLAPTGGLQMGAWQQEDLLYVLVIDAENSRLRLDDVLRDPKLAMLLLRQP